MRPCTDCGLSKPLDAFLLIKSTRRAGRTAYQG
jgi:hypothetical protein